MTEAPVDRTFRTILILTVIAVPLALEDTAILDAYYIKLLVLQLGLLALFIRAAQLRIRKARTSPLLLPIGLVLASGLVTSIWAVNRVEATVQIAQKFTLACLFFVCLQTMTLRDFRPVIVAACGTAGVVNVIGLCQYTGVAFLGLSSGGMPSATFGYRNYAAMFLIQAIPWTLYLLIRSDHSQRLLWALNLALLTAFLLATRTRAAWAGLGLACVLSAVGIFVFLRKTQPRLASRIGRSLPRIAIPALLAIILGLTVSPDMGGFGYDSHSREKTELSGAVTSLFQPGSDKDRLTMWRNTVPLIADHPHGVGPGNWQYVYTAYDGGDVTWKGGLPRRPHNDYLWMIAELGVLGGAAYLALFGIAVFLGIRGTQSEDEDQNLLVLAATTGLVAIGAQAFFSFPSERIASSTLTWLSPSSPCAANRRHDTSHRSIDSSSPARAPRSRPRSCRSKPFASTAPTRSPSNGAWLATGRLSNRLRPRPCATVDSTLRSI